MKKIIAGIGILIALYLILSKGDTFATLIDTVVGGASNAITTLQKGA